MTGSDAGWGGRTVIRPNPGGPRQASRPPANPPLRADWAQPVRGPGGDWSGAPGEE